MSQLAQGRVREMDSNGSFIIVVDRSHSWLMRLLVAGVALASVAAGVWFAVYALRHADNIDGALVGLLAAAVGLAMGMLYGLVGAPQSWFGRTTIELTTSHVRVSYLPKPRWRAAQPRLVDRSTPVKHAEGFELRLVPIFSPYTPIWARRLHLRTHREAIQIDLGDLGEKALASAASRLNEVLDQVKGRSAESPPRP